MIYIKPFKVKDFHAFDSIESPEEEMSEELIQAIEDSGLAVTITKNGEIVGCGGAHPINNIRGELWLRLSKNCHGISTLRWIKDCLKIYKDTYPFEQLSATVECCFEKGTRLAEYLGFEQPRKSAKKIHYILRSTL